MTVDIFFKDRKIPLTEKCDTFSLDDGGRIVRLHTYKSKESHIRRLTAVFNFDAISDIHISYE